MHLKALVIDGSQIWTGSANWTQSAFADNIEAAAEFGVKFIVEPGGSKKDAECVVAADAAGLAMAFTGCRHFRH